MLVVVETEVCVLDAQLRGKEDGDMGLWWGGTKAVGGWVVSGKSISWQRELCTRARLEPTLALTDHTTPALGLLYSILHTSKRVQ